MNKLIHGDCLEILQDMTRKSVDLVVTDPPYEIGNVGKGCFGNRECYKEIEGMIDGFSDEVLDELCRVMKAINIYIFCSQKQILKLINYFSAKNCSWNILTWHKTNPVPMCSNKYLTDTEYIIFAREKGVKVMGEYATKKTYFVTPVNKADKKLYNHPTVKPVEIIRNFIINSSNEGEIVLDPFMGTGSTGVACKELNREFIGIEINEEYFDTAKSRIEG